MLKTYQCKGDIHISKTANIILPGLMTEYRWMPLSSGKMIFAVLEIWMSPLHLSF